MHDCKNKPTSRYIMSDLEDDYNSDEFDIPDEILIEEDKDDPEDFSKVYETETPLIDMQEVYRQNPTAYEKTENVAGYELAESDIEECSNMLKLNRHLIYSLQELKKRTTAALEKCERKLSLIETSLEKHSSSEFKVMICNAGMPYFKDKNYFSAPCNDDEQLKLSRGEIQVENLPRVSAWTSKERNTLLKTIREEVIAEVLQPREPEGSETDSTPEKSLSKAKMDRRKKKCGVPIDFKDMVGPLGQREFDWLKIAGTHFERRHPPIDCRVIWNVFLHPDINKSRWEKSEDNKLKIIAKQCKYQDWEEIAKQLNTNRTAYQCFIRYNSTKKHPKISSSTWRKKEDEKLLKLIEIFRIGDFVPWGEVASWMPNRTKQQVYFRWTYSLAPYLVKGRFTKAEDKILIEGVTKYGQNFCKISAMLMPTRSAIQLNNHYQQLIMNTNENAHVWTEEEDETLLRYHARVGADWSRIAKALTNKTRTQVRHRYTSLKKCHKGNFPIFGIEEDEEDEEETRHKEVESIRAAPKEKDEDFNSNTDKELIEYFRIKRMPEKSNSAQTLYSPEELKSTTRKLYDILQTLHAKLEIPDDIDEVELNDREKQLLLSLKEYTKTKNSNHWNAELVEEYELRMFGCNREETSHFIPPLPFNPQLKKRKLSKTKTIEYQTNRSKESFSLENPMETESIDFIVSYIGGEQQELQFEKLSRLLTSSTRNVKQDTVKKIYILPPKLLAEKHCTNVKGNSVSNSSSTSTTHEQKQSFNDSNRSAQQELTRFGTSFKLLEEAPYVPTVPYVETVADKQEISAIEPTYATLSGLKILMYLKRLFDTKYKECMHMYQSDHKSKEVQEACNLLETRMEQLFKYSVGLSKTVTPQVDRTDVFSYDDVTKKRKHATKLGSQPKKKLKNVRS